ncbi:putative dienelactone hydrolase [Thermoascus aurantiacus ATCC 26904]
MAEINKACCTRTPVGTNQKVPVEKIGGVDVYVTGNTSAKRGVVLVYDIFGYYPQTLLGADRLAQHLDALTLVPDLFEGTQGDINWLSMEPAERMQAVQKFLTEVAEPKKNAEKLVAIVTECKKKYPSIEKWGVLGLCWGGKLAAIVSGPQSLFNVSGQAHPSFLDTNEARNMTIPHIVLASYDESKEQIADYKAALESRAGIASEVETYGTMFHGWMGARANLDDEENKKEFERGYKQIATFFDKYL